MMRVIPSAARNLHFPLLIALIVCAATRPTHAQSLGDQVSRAPDGVVRMQFDSRPGTCGDGRDLIGYGHAMFARGVQSYGGGHWMSSSCVPGPLRVELSVSAGEVTRIETHVGGTWHASSKRVTDLGTVPSRDASTYLFTLVPKLERSGTKDRLLIPAVLAADADPLAPLLALVHDERRLMGTRRNAVFWLGQTGDPRALRALHEIIESAREDDRIRAHAIFALSQSPDAAPSDYAWLRGMYARLGDDELRRAVFQAMLPDESGEAGRWLIGHVMDDGEPTELRRNALFWAGQREATPTSELSRVYREVRDPGLREHAIFVLSQRRDEEATDMLLGIARDDRDSRLRAKALFWLAQKDDPRVQKLIAELILK